MQGPRRAVVLAALAFVVPSADRAAATVPPGFADEEVATVVRATAIAFTPDGRMLTPTKDGMLHVTEPGGAPQPALDISQKVCFDNERGLLGVAVDPLFTQNRFIYLYYTFKKFPGCDPTGPATPVNRVARFVLADTNLVDPASEAVLVDNIPAPSGIHFGGDLGFGGDGYLYASVGDGGCDFRGNSGCHLLNDAARDLGGLNGKILRITRDGLSPPDNPFVGTHGVPCRTTGFTQQNNRCTEIWAYGLRNPFRFAFDEAGVRLNINDVGASKWEEVDRGAAGADYGWNVREGPCVRDSATDCGPPPAGMTNPLHSYDHSAGCTSITPAAFVPGGVWPSAHDGAYVYGDLVCGKLFELFEGAGGSVTVQEFGSGLGNLIDATFGPHGDTQALYYITWGEYPNDTVRRVSYVGSANRSPEAVADAAPRAGAVPLSVQFSGTRSTDADGDDLAYRWDFGDGSAPRTGAERTHTYTQAGTFTAQLRVTDGEGGADVATVRIRPGSQPPQPTISSPASGQRFAVGESVTLSGSATDPEDGPLPAGALTWEVIRHHDTHTHPFLPPTTGQPLQVEGPAPEDIHATTNSHLEVILTATDSDGLSTTVRRDLFPRTVSIGFATEPSGLTLEVAGSQVVAPATVTSWEAWRIPVTAPDQVDPGGTGVTFVSWSDGGDRTHEIATPASPATYTARFTRSYARPQGATPARFSLVLAYSRCDAPDLVHGPPLEHPSCAAPALRSGRLVTGTPDANGLGANLTGRVRYAALAGDPATPADEADVKLIVELSDVREAQSLADYEGELEVVTPLRITDSQNGTGGTDAATVADQDLRAAVPCAATPGGPSGGNCELLTTVDALIPGAITERTRTIWELGQPEVRDGGPDGDADTTAGNETFAVPGVFVP